MSPVFVECFGQQSNSFLDVRGIMGAEISNTQKVSESFEKAFLWRWSCWPATRKYLEVELDRAAEVIEATAKLVSVRKQIGEGGPEFYLTRDGRGALRMLDRLVQHVQVAEYELRMEEGGERIVTQSSQRGSFVNVRGGTSSMTDAVVELSRVTAHSMNLAKRAGEVAVHPNLFKAPR